MTSWPTRPDVGGDNTYHDSQPAYANVPTSPSPMENLHPPVRSPVPSSNGRNSYVPSRLNPNAPATAGPGSRSRPPSWGPQAALQPGNTGVSTSSDNSQGSNMNGKDAQDIRNVMTGAVGSGFGPYAVRHTLRWQDFFSGSCGLACSSTVPFHLFPPKIECARLFCGTTAQSFLNIVVRGVGRFIDDRFKIPEHVFPKLQHASPRRFLPLFRHATHRLCHQFVYARRR